MKICLVWQGYDPREVRIAKFADAITAAGGSVTIVHRGTPGAGAGPSGLPSIDFVPVPGGRRATVPVPANPLWARAVRSVLARVRFDLVLVRDIPLFPLVWAVAPSGVPVAIDMAEHYPEAMRSWGKYATHPVARLLVHRWRVPDRVEAFSVRRAAAVAVVCEEQRERLQRDYGYPRERIELVMNTPAESALGAGARDAPHGTEIVFGYHGILCEDRQLETVLAGFELAALHDDRLRLLLCGDGESARTLRELAARSPVADRIEFTGRYRPEQQRGLYARAHFGIVSLRDTPFTRHTVGNKFFDYPALGIPFLYPSLPVLQRIAGRIGSGFEFRAGDAASFAEAMRAAVRADYAVASARGMAAVRAEFTWERDRARLLAMLDRAVARR